MVNIVTGLGSEIGDALVTHPKVAKVAFTGGDRTGAGVYAAAARSIKPVTLELGGNIEIAEGEGRHLRARRRAGATPGMRRGLVRRATILI